MHVQQPDWWTGSRGARHMVPLADHPSTSAEQKDVCYGHKHWLPVLGWQESRSLLALWPLCTERHTVCHGVQFSTRHAP